MKSEIKKEKPSFFDSIILFSLGHKKIVIVVSLILVTIGAFFIFKVNNDVFQNLNRPILTIFVETHDLDPREVETLVTMPLETAVNKAAGVRNIRSVSKRGIAILNVELDGGTNIFINRRAINERILSVKESLPPSVQPILGPISSTMKELQFIGLHEKEGSTSFLSFTRGIFTLSIINGNIFIASLVGFIALAGISSRNALRFIKLSPVGHNYCAVIFYRIDRKII